MCEESYDEYVIVMKGLSIRGGMPNRAGIFDATGEVKFTNCTQKYRGGLGNKKHFTLYCFSASGTGWIERFHLSLFLKFFIINLYI